MFSFQKYRHNGWLQALLDVGFIGLNAGLCLWISRNQQQWDDQYLLWPLLILPSYAVIRGGTLVVWLIKAIDLRRMRLVAGILAHLLLLVVIAWVALSLMVLFSGMAGVTPDGTEAR